MARSLSRIVKSLLVILGSVLTLAAVTLGALLLSFKVLDGRKDILEEYLTGQLERPVKIEHLETKWQEFSPAININGVTIQSQAGKFSSVELGELALVIDPWQLVFGRLRFKRILVLEPKLEIVRHIDGTLFIGEFKTEDQSEQPDVIALSWLLRQDHTEIKQAQLIWRDHKESDRVVKLNNLNVRVWNDRDRHRFIGSASLLARSDQRLRLDGELRGTSLEDGAWDGSINIDVQHLDLQQLPLFIQQQLPVLTGGVLNARVATSWIEGRVQGVSANVMLSDFSIPILEDSATVNVQSFSSEVAWDQETDRSWVATLTNPTLEFVNQKVDTKFLSVRKQDDEYTYHTDSIEIDNVVGILEDMKIDIPGKEYVLGMQPKGKLKNISVIVQGSQIDSESWELEAELEDIELVAFKDLPGLTNIQGSVEITEDYGQMEVWGEKSSLDLPQIFRRKFQFDDLRGNLRWLKTGDEWVVNISKLWMQNPQLRLQDSDLTIHVPDDIDKPVSHVDMTFNLPWADVATIKNYLPAVEMSDDVVAWLDNALVSGELKDSVLKLKGNLDQFPFREGGGVFDLKTKMLGSEINFAEGWPTLQKLEVNLEIYNVGLSASIRSGEIWNSQITGAEIDSDDVFRDAVEVSIGSTLSAPINDVVRFLMSGPLIKKPGRVDISGVGGGDLQIEMRLPLANLDIATVKGSYHVQDLDLSIENRDLFEDLAGKIEFTESTVSGSAITGKLLEGQVRMDVETVTPQVPPVWAINATGVANIKSLAALLGKRIVKHASGESPWTGRFEVNRGAAELNVSSTLKGIDIRLPAPLGKKRDEERSTVVTAKYAGENREYVFDIAPLRGHLQFKKEDLHLRMQKALFTLGEVEPQGLPDKGFKIVARYPRFDADEWLAVVPALNKEDNSETRRNPGVSDNSYEVQLDVGQFRFLSRELGKFKANAASINGREWNAQISGDTAHGDAKLMLPKDDFAGRYWFDLDYLYWPRTSPGDDTDKENDIDDIDPRRFPGIEITAKTFRYGGWRLGRLELMAEPQQHGWRIAKARFTQPVLNIDAAGDWRWQALDNGTMTVINMSLESNDIGTALERLGFGKQSKEGSGDLVLALSWSGGPHNFAFSKLDGSYDVNAAKGSFLNVDPGSGRLLGLFNIGAVSRRLSLDFSDVFSKGLAFDRIRGKGSIKNGDLFTDQLFVVGPSASIEVEGRTGLAAEDYDLTLIVAPQLGANISLMSALANPLAGAVMFLAQKVFKKQLAGIVHYRYDVTGPWESPEIVRITREPVPTDR